MLRKTHLSLFLLFLTLALAGVGAWAQGFGPQGDTSSTAATGTAFTYQGQLTDGGSPASGNYDFQFTLYDAASGGNQVGGTLTKSSITVSNGIFSVELDFGNVFDGTALWLEVAVRPAGSGSYTTLSPRQALTAVPYAVHALGVPWSGLTGVPAGFADGTDDDTIYTAGTGLALNGTTFSITSSYRLPQTCTNGQIAEWDGTAWVCASNAGGGGGDITAVNAGTGLTGGGTTGSVTMTLDTNYTDNRYWKLGGTNVTTSSAFLGTTNYATLTLGVENRPAMRLVPTGGDSLNIIGGSQYNVISGTSAVGVVIAGGGSSSEPNIVSNWASYSTIGGGARNFITTTSFLLQQYMTIAGGAYNEASSTGAAIGGGESNTVSGSDATVPGGYLNTAAGTYSLAAGTMARAMHLGTFVWGGYVDSLNWNDYITSGTERQFIVRSENGIWFGNVTTAYTVTDFSATSLISTSTGAHLTIGGVWTDASDRNQKENFRPVDPETVLETVAQLPVTTWNYKAEDPSVRHMGPVAQDFYAAFGLGADDKHIASLDANGVALAAIQGLYARNQEQAARIEALEAQNAELQTQLDALEQRLAALERRVNGPTPARSSLLSGAGLLLLAVGVVWTARRKGDQR